MLSISMLRNWFLLVSAASFAAAYLASAHWLILAALFLCFAFWHLLRRQSVFWRSSGLVTVSVALAAIGVMLGLSVILMSLAMSAALGAWDLANFDATLTLSRNPEARRTIAGLHLRSLFVAPGAGMLLMLSAVLIRLTLPFAAMGAAALVLFTALMSAAPRVLGLDR